MATHCLQCVRAHQGLFDCTVQSLFGFVPSNRTRSDITSDVHLISFIEITHQNCWSPECGKTGDQPSRGMAPVIQYGLPRSGPISDHRQFCSKSSTLTNVCLRKRVHIYMHPERTSSDAGKCMTSDQNSAPSGVEMEWLY